MRWGIAACLLAWSSVAVAQPADVASGVSAPSAEAPLGYGAMPGGVHAPSAETLPGSMFGVSLLGGFGVRSGLLTADHKMSRGIGDIAFAFAPTDMITLGLAFDGRFDKHKNGLTAGGDDGYVGDPRLIARFGKRAGSLTAGGQLTILVPGKDAPSIAFNAITVEARGLLSLAAGPGTFSLGAGFRLDNSAKSVVDDNGDDNRMVLTAEDRVSLGVSDFNAVLASAHYQLPAGKKAYVGVEASLDLFLGKDDFDNKAPGPIVRVGATGGFKLAPHWTAFAFVQYAKVPSIKDADAMAGNIILIPYEPTITGGFGIAAHFGGPKGRGGNGLDDNKIKAPIPVDVLADVTGVVTDDTGKPMAGAKVAFKTKNKNGNFVTDSNGEYKVQGVKIGSTLDGKTTLDDAAAEITVEVEGKKPKSTTLTLVQGANTVPAITLDPTLPPGQFKAVVRAAGTGTPLKGITVKLDPGGASAVSDEQGNVSIDVQPGTYKATAVGSSGYKDQTLENIVIEQATVNVKQFELRK